MNESEFFFSFWISKFKKKILLFVQIAEKTHLLVRKAQFKRIQCAYRETLSLNKIKASK